MGELAILHQLTRVGRAGAKLFGIAQITFSGSLRVLAGSDLLPSSSLPLFCLEWELDCTEVR